MLNRIKAKYRLNNCIGISFRQEADSLSFRCCRVRLEKDNLEIEETWEAADWETLEGKKIKDIPLILHLDARQILIKESLNNDLGDDQLKSIFPSYDSTRFYTAKLNGEGKSWIAFVRKDYISEILDRFVVLGYQIVSVFIGPFVLDNILAQINDYGTEYTFDTHSIQLVGENKHWLNYRSGKEFTSRFALKIGDHPIKEQFLMAYAVAFSALMIGYVNDYSLAIPHVNEQREIWLEKRKFKLNFIALAAILFLLLLINTFLFTHYYEQNQKLEGRVNTQQNTVKDLDKLEDQIRDNEHLLADLGWNGGISKAWLLDQIGYSIRQYAQIALTQIQINPQIKGLGSNIIQKPDQILIQGTSPTLEILNLWLRELKNNPWITKVSIEEYGNKQQGETLDAFTIKINYNDGVERN
ncbi:hypothetical protein D3C87_511190 [compost metagenome]